MQLGYDCSRSSNKSAAKVSPLNVHVESALRLCFVPASQASVAAKAGTVINRVARVLSNIDVKRCGCLPTASGTITRLAPQHRGPMVSKMESTNPMDVFWQQMSA